MARAGAAGGEPADPASLARPRDTRSTRYPPPPRHSSAIIRPEHPVGGHWGAAGGEEAGALDTGPLPRGIERQPPPPQDQHVKPGEAGQPPLPRSASAAYGPSDEPSAAPTPPAAAPAAQESGASEKQPAAIATHKASRRGGWPGGVPPPASQPRPSRKRAVPAPAIPAGSAAPLTDSTCAAPPRTVKSAAPPVAVSDPLPAAWHGLGARGGSGGGALLPHQATTLVLG